MPVNSSTATTAVVETGKGLDPGKLNVHVLCSNCLELSILNRMGGFFLVVCYFELFVCCVLLLYLEKADFYQISAT